MTEDGEAAGPSSGLGGEFKAQENEPGDASRRRFVLGAAYAITFGASLGLAGCGGGHEEGGQRFGYGIASGDPLSDRVILWTRVNVSSPADVQWEVATDEAFANIVRSGTATTDDARDYTVKVDAAGLQAAPATSTDFATAARPRPRAAPERCPWGSRRGCGWRSFPAPHIRLASFTLMQMRRTGGISTPR
jgi:hypothetical protein